MMGRGRRPRVASDEELKLIAKKARKPETIREAAAEWFEQARQQPTVDGRIRARLAWHGIRGLASWDVMPPWEGLLDDLPHGERIEGTLAALTFEPRVAAGAANLLRLYARPEDADRLLTPALEACRQRDDVRAGAARALLTRLASLAPGQVDPVITKLLRSSRATDIDLALMLLPSPAAAKRLPEHLSQIVRLMVVAKPERRRTMLERVRSIADPTAALPILRDLVGRLDVEGAIDDGTMAEARRAVAEAEDRVARAAQS